MTVKDKVAVYDKAEEIEKKYCGAKTKSGKTCERPQGWGTWHPGQGKCKLHGGASPSGPRSMYVQHDQDLLERVKELKEDPNLTSIPEQIALSIAMMERAVNNLESDESSKLEQAKSVGVISTNLAKMIETNHKIQVGHYLSPDHVQDQIRKAAGHIQRSCKGCDKLETLAQELQAMTSQE